MKFSRRDFIHAGCLAGAITLVPHFMDQAKAGLIHRGSPFKNPLLSQRNIINVNFNTEYNYGYINHLIPADAMLSPVGSAYQATASTFTQLIDQNGYPNNSAASGGGTGTSGAAFGGGFRLPASSNFSGLYVITWDGDGQFTIASGTWTEASTSSTGVGNANGTTTLSGFSSVVGISPSFGISGTGVPGGTTVISVNYLTKTIVVSAAVTTGSGITFTFTNGTYTKNSNGKWTATPGVKPYIVASVSALAANTLSSFQVGVTGGTPVSVSLISWTGGVATVTTAAPHGRPLGYSLSLTFAGATPNLINGTFLCTVTGASTYTFALASNPGAITGTITYTAFLTNIAVYRQVDEVDFMPTSVGGNGYIFRAPFKQIFVNANPAGIRFLNWTNLDSTGTSPQCRWEYRSLPTKAGLNVNWVAGPTYGVTAGAANQYSLSASAGTPSNPQTTPASMQHGEVVICRAGNASIRAKSSPTAITQANPGSVTAAAHGYSNGDLVIFKTATNNNTFIGMVELNYVVVTVANAATNTFDLHDINGNPIDTTTFTAFVAAGGNANAAFIPYMTLQVGSGNDRVAYPVMWFAQANVPFLNANTVAVGQYYSFYFDKNYAGVRTAGTNPALTTGAWFVLAGASASNTPIEYCAALVAEINIMSKAQGINNPIHMYMNVPIRGLLSCDPDYTPQSNWVLNAISAAFNGGYGCLGLSQTTANLILEWSNELWNFGSVTTNAITWLNYIRNPTANQTAQFTAIQGLRASVMARDAATSPFASRVYKTLGMQGTFGWTGANQLVALGTGIYFTDPWNTWGSATPLSFNDCVNWASYFDVRGEANYTNTTTGTGTFTDDSAMFNGTDNSGNGGGNYTGGANPTQACQNFVTQMVANTDQGIAGYLTAGASFNAGMVTQGKRHIQYEGGANWITTTGGLLNAHTITAGDTLFLIGIYESSAWATAQINFFNSIVAADSVAGPMSIFTFLTGTSGSGFRWAYAAPDTYLNPPGTGAEGDAFNIGSPLWIGFGSRNRSLPT